MLDGHIEGLACLPSAKAILENWEFSDEMAAAVGDPERSHQGRAGSAGSARRHRPWPSSSPRTTRTADAIDEALDGPGGPAKRFGLNKERAPLDDEGNARPK